MSVWGVGMVKDEADVIEQTLRHLRAEGLAGVVLLDNGSTDGTHAILKGLEEELGGATWDTRWLRVIEDPEVGYWQSSKMTAAARMAAKLGASWVVPFDADEIWYSPDGRPLAEAILMDARPDVTVRNAALFDHRSTFLDPAVLPVGEDDPFTRMTWRHPEPIPLPKVAIRTDALRKVHMGNHGADVSTGRALAGLEVRHFPYRSAEHMIRKARNGAAAYAATSLDPMYGAHWRSYGRMTDDELRSVFTTSFWFLDPEAAGLVDDPAPVRS